MELACDRPLLQRGKLSGVVIEPIMFVSSVCNN